MRTRFLCIDYFNPSPNQTLGFLRLPPPRHLPLPPPPPLSSDLLSAVSAFDLSLELDPFPINDALDKFLSGVLPKFIHVEDRECSAHSEEKTKQSFEAKEDSCIDVVEFEVPQMDISSENGCLLEKKLELFSEMLEAEGDLGTIEPDLTFHYPSEALESVYLIDDITSSGHTYQKPFLLEDAYPALDQLPLSDCTFPLLEVDEISLGITNGICIEEEVLLLDKIETLLCVNSGEVVDNGKELWGSLNIDILEYISGPSSSDKSFLNVMECSNSYPQMDLIGILELSYLDGNHAYQGETTDDKSISMRILKFEEYQFLDFIFYQFEEVLCKLASVSEAETEKMPLEDLVVVDFNELIVSHELTPIDESFKSLPIPILSDYGSISSHYELVEEILASLEPQPPSTSVDIYLDWQFLEEDYGTNEKYSSCWKQVLEIDKYSIDPKSFVDGMLIFDFIFNSATPNVGNIEDNKETLDVHSDAISPAGKRLNDVTTSRLNHDERQKPGYAERISSLVRSMPPFDNLNFFLNPREDASGKSSNPSAKVLEGEIKSKGKLTEATVSAIPSLDQIAPCATAKAQPQPCNLNLHQVYLSGCVLELIDNFQKNYLAILKGDALLGKIQKSSLAIDDNALLSLPKNTLMDWIKKANDRKKCVDDNDDPTIALVTLCAIKQMAWYLCYFGIQATYIYLKQLCQALDCLKYKFSFLRTLIEDVHAKAMRDITTSHPSLSVIQSVLQSQINRGGLKILIVAHQVFWLSLKRLLTSLHISYCDLHSDSTHRSQPDLCGSILEAMQHSDCLLISTEHISASFRFDIFSVVLEYGGSCSSSRLSTIFPKPLGFPGLHFFKLELEEYSTTKALCEGVGMPCSTSSPTELERLLNFIPCEEKYLVGSSSQEDVQFQIETEQVSKNLPNVPPAEELEGNPGDISSFPDTLIIVNTQNLNKEMIISRRSTYQKILAMEKRGAQVVERDLKFPVDVIISAAMCLVWYDCGNIREKATDPDEAASSLPSCIENIAANILTSLSFSFGCCILVFEGASNFLFAVTESSDELYAAAFSLRMDLQLFLSHSSELTDEIILNCIESTASLTSHIYPKMPESETLAESFLTSFPSLNPLSAHAILSSEGTLVEFLEWSNERRLRAIRKYRVPDVSFRLLSTLCKYGEREDTRSAMTDCSSASSPPESRSYHCKPESVKKVRYSHSPLKVGIDMDGLFNFELLKQFDDDNQNQPKVSQSHDNWVLGVDENFDEIEQSGIFSSDSLFRGKQGTRAAGVAPMMKPLRVSKHINSQMPTCTSYEMKKRTWPFDGELFGLEEPGHISSLAKFNLDFNKKSRNPNEDSRGEVIDISDSFPALDDFSSIPTDHSGLGFETDRSLGTSRTARRLSFSGGHLHTFPTSTEISSDSNLWDNIDDEGQNSSKQTNLDFTRNKLPPKHKGELLEKCSEQKEATYFPSQSVRERYKQQQSGSALAKAVLSSQPQQGSPWTIEFLNRIREKSRLRQQALPPKMSPIYSPFTKNSSKGTKRRSPSILDFYRYQGGSTKTPRKINEPKRQRRSSQPPASSKKEMTVPSAFSACTPLDKRARRTLLFSTGGGGGQSKLIWSDEGVHNLDRKFYHRARN